MNIHAPFVEVNVAAEYLGKTLDEVRTMVREGQVREFRDAGRIFFKTQDILELAGTRARATSPYRFYLRGSRRGGRLRELLTLPVAKAGATKL